MKRHMPTNRDIEWIFWYGFDRCRRDGCRWSPKLISATLASHFPGAETMQVSLETICQASCSSPRFCGRTTWPRSSACNASSVFPTPRSGPRTALTKRRSRSVIGRPRFRTGPCRARALGSGFDHRLRKDRDRHLGGALNNVHDPVPPTRGPQLPDRS